jgi:hypothetical protein
MCGGYSMTDKVVMNEFQAKLYTNCLCDEFEKLPQEDQDNLEKIANDLNDKLMKEAGNFPDKAMLVVYIMYSSVLQAMKLYGMYQFFPDREENFSEREELKT